MKLPKNLGPSGGSFSQVRMDCYGGLRAYSGAVAYEKFVLGFAPLNPTYGLRRFVSALLGEDTTQVLEGQVAAAHDQNHFLSCQPLADLERCSQRRSPCPFGQITGVFQ